MCVFVHIAHRCLLGSNQQLFYKIRSRLQILCDCVVDADCRWKIKFYLHIKVLRLLLQLAKYGTSLGAHDPQVLHAVTVLPKTCRGIGDWN